MKSYVVYTKKKVTKKELSDFHNQTALFFVIRWRYFRCCQNLAKRRFGISKTQYLCGC